MDYSTGLEPGMITQGTSLLTDWGHDDHGHVNNILRIFNFPEAI